jgi:MFS family permease
VALPAQAHSAVALGLVLVVFGVGYGGQNVAMNAVAVDLVAALRRPVMSSFHAVYSLGGMLGAALGGLVASRLSAAVHLGALAVLGVVATAVLSPFLVRGPEPVAPEPVAPEPVRPARGSGVAASGGGRTGRAAGTVVLFGVIAGCTAYGEGSMADWSALHLSQDLGAAPGVAALGYSVFALAMTVGRVTGTTVQQRFGRTGTLVGGGLLAAAGMLVGALAPMTWLVFVGFVVMGLGLSNIFPVAIGRAGALSGPNGVAVASTLGYGGLLIGPPVIGFLSDWLSMPVALITVSILAALAAALGYVARDAGRRPRRLNCP